MRPTHNPAARLAQVRAGEALEAALIAALETPGLLDDPKSAKRIQALLAQLQKELTQPCSTE